MTEIPAPREFLRLIAASLLLALIRKGSSPPAQLVTAWRNHQFHLAMTSELIGEVEMVLKREKISKKYSLTPEEIEKL
jgi:predicted nucleic acid-binding protein